MIFETASEFSMYIEQLAHDKDSSLVDVIVDYCTENYIDPFDIAPLIGKSLKDKIEIEFQDMNYLQKTGTWDF